MEQFHFKYVAKNTDGRDDIDFSGDKEVSMTLNGEHNLTQLFSELKGFLEACGYCFELTDTIQVVNDGYLLGSLNDSDDNIDIEIGEGGFDPELHVENITLQQEDINTNHPNYVPPAPENEPVLYGAMMQEHIEKTRKDQTDEMVGAPITYYEPATIPVVKHDPSKEKLDKIMETILPFLENLKKDSGKTTIMWPNRGDAVEKQIQSLKNIISE